LTVCIYFLNDFIATNTFAIYHGFSPTWCFSNSNTCHFFRIPTCKPLCVYWVREIQTLCKCPNIFTIHITFHECFIFRETHPWHSIHVIANLHTLQITTAPTKYF
jgi:hypothetical protein